MDFFDTIEARHSIRSYSNRPIESEKIQKILEYTCKAPSAGNLQGFEIFIVTSESQRILLVDCAYSQEFIRQAPYVLIICVDPGRSAAKYKERGRVLYCIQDATIACTYAMLSATALGLSTVWVGAFDEEAIRKVLGIPGTLRSIIMLPIGYSRKPHRITSRRPIKEIVHFVNDGSEKEVIENI
jgi:nitroreductase